MKTIVLARTQTTGTIEFALKELAKYLRCMDRSVTIDERLCEKYDAEKPYIWVGTDIEFPIETVLVEDKNLDDAIYLEVKNYVGIISGANERAVLIAVYRFLKELGVAFIRPTGDGEIIPRKELSNCEVYISEAPSYRHRTICIEGACSYEHVYHMIDWIPKAGMNGYMIQFVNPAHYFTRWYGHERGRNMDIFPFEKAEGFDIKRQMEEELARRSLMYHAVGHGWTVMHLGLGEDATRQYDKPLSDIVDQGKYLALVDGERKFWNDEPIWTELCYSNQEAQQVYIQAVLDYCEKHPNITYVHAWLSDGEGNHCQCENCKHILPSDFYVQMMNKLDEALTAKGLETKVVFLTYHETLWAPEFQKIKNKDRFVMMFAPSCRAFYQSFADIDFTQKESIPEFSLINPPYPQKVSTVVSMFEQWRERTSVKDCFDFDYHLWEAHLSDPGYTGISQIIFKDVCALDKIQVNGLVSCQLMRMGFPTNLPMQSMAEGLWNKHADYEAICEKYYQNAFGEKGKLVRDYLERLTALLAPIFVDEEKYHTLSKRELADMAQEALETVASFEEKIHSIMSQQVWIYEAQRLSWYYLSEHCKIVKLEAQIIYLKNIEAEKKLIDAVRDELEEIACDMEANVHKVFDVWRFNGTFRRMY